MYISIKGSIGVGKTTILHELERILGTKKYSFLKEPVDKFSKFKSFNPLELSYQDPYRYCPITQMHIVKQSAMYYPKKDENKQNKVYITERCVESPLVFIERDYIRKIFDAFVYSYLTYYVYENKEHYGSLNPNVIIYLDAKPETCYNRLRKRDRKEKKLCSLELLNHLNECYKTYLDYMFDKYSSKIYSCNAEVNVDTIVQNCLTIIHKVI